MGSAKKWQPEDELIRDALVKLIGGFDGSEREVSRRSGLNQSRLRTILDGTRAPASVGETIRITEAIGHQASDVLRTIESAVEAMREVMDTVPMRGRIVIGEGERDEAPMLYIGEEVGGGSFDDDLRNEFPEVDIAVDPLEGTNLCALGANNAIAVLAFHWHTLKTVRTEATCGLMDSG